MSETAVTTRWDGAPVRARRRREGRGAQATAAASSRGKRCACGQTREENLGHSRAGVRGSKIARQLTTYDLRNPVAAHRDAVEHVGCLHRALLVRDHDELRAIGVAAQQLDEAADVRVV